MSGFKFNFNFSDVQVEETVPSGWVGHQHVDMNIQPIANQPQPNLPMRNHTREGDVVIGSRLFLFSPKKTFSFMVRPHTYNFRDVNQDVLQLMANNFNQSNPIVNTSIKDHPDVLSMIKPAHQGHIVNLNPLSDLWTFVLIIDTQASTGTTSHMLSSIFRTVSTGFCLDEPINTMTKTHNPNAKFKFNHHTSYQYRSNRFGIMANPLPLVNHDIIPSEFVQGAATAHQIFAKLDPCSMRATGPYEHALKEFNGYSGLMTSGPTLSPGTNPKIDAGIKLGSAHLQNLTSYMYAAKNQTAEYGRRDRFGTASPSMGENFSTAFYNLLSSDSLPPATGIGSYEILAFSSIDYMFPNLEVVPVVTNNNPRQWDVYNSEIINPLNVYNSWVADTIAFLCETSGVVKLAFTYDSFCGNRWEKEGRWYVYPGQFETIHGYDQQKAIETFEHIKHKLEQDLFSIMRIANGEFDLTVNYRFNAETLINLTFKDETPIGALFEHPTHLGGMISPNVGDINVYQNNSENLQGFVNLLESVDTGV